MVEVVLFEPEIAPNTGNIIRLCANTGCRLHLIEPLGFDLEERKLRRAGLDYHDLTVISLHPDFATFLERHQERRLLAFTTKAEKHPTDISFHGDELLLFGPESRGLPDDILSSLPHSRKLRLPMRPKSRSLNLSNAVSVVVYEAWRQLGFSGGN